MLFDSSERINVLISRLETSDDCFWLTNSNLFLVW